MCKKGHFRSASAAILAFGLSASILQAQNVLIDELLAGANGDSSAQFIELRFLSAADRLWGPQGVETEGRARLLFRDARGEFVSEFIFPTDPPLGLEDPIRGGFSVLVATQAFADLAGQPAPDFIMPAAIVGVSGKVCFTGNPDNPNPVDVNLCLSYGNFIGSTEESSGNPAAALPIVNAVSLQRIGNFDAWSQQSNADFTALSPAPRNSAGVVGQLTVASNIAQGETLFTRETFQGNGRTCFTCHRPEDQFGLSPDTIALLPADDPLFVAEFNPDLAELENPCLMKDGRALILENIDGFDEAPVFRGSPHLLNLALTAPYGLSGEFENLRQFTTGAVQQHFPRTLSRNSDPAIGPTDFRLPTEEELQLMEAFQLSIILPADGNYDLDRMIQSAIERGGDAVEIDAGRELFFGEAKCFNCHGGPVLAEVDPLLDSGNVSFDTGVVNLGDNDFLDCLDGPLPPEAGGARRFSVPSLIGISTTGPFFHDAVAETLDEAVGFYSLDVFDDSPAGILLGGIELTSDERDQITAFLGALTEVTRVHNLTQATGFDTIQEALSAAVDGDEIVVDPGTYFENIDFGDTEVILHSIDPLDDAIVAATIIDGAALDCVVQLSAGLLSGFTIRNGSAIGPLAGGVEAAGTAVVSHNVITGNVAEQRGGGVSATENALVHNNRIIGNTAGNRAGGVSGRDDAIVINNVISNNQATIGGGGLRAQENVLVRNNTMISNSSEETGSGVSGGGGILAEDSAVLINNIIAFTADGVGIQIDEGSTVVANFNCLFANADGDFGGDAVAGPNDLSLDPHLDADGIHLLASSPCINVGDPALISLDEETDIDGGSRIVDGRIEIGADEVLPVRNLTHGIQYLSIQEAIDAAVDGDEIQADTRTYFENIDFLNKNIALRSIDPLDLAVVGTTILDGSGEGTVVRMSAGTLSGFTITHGGLSGDDAAGVHATGTALVSHNLITNNEAETNGGGVTAEDTARVQYNLVIGNTAAERAGGVSARDNSVVIDNYIAFNSAQAGGGGIRTRESPTIRNNTIVFNSSADTGSGLLGGGGILAGGGPTILNNVIAFSTDGADLHLNPGDIAAADYNCVFGGFDGEYGGVATPGLNDVNADPLLDIDGFHLLALSPCINAGDPNFIPLEGETDIDGQARIQGSPVDIGADETAVILCEGDANADGAIDPLDSGYVQARFGCSVGSGNAECDAADVNADVIVDPLDVGFILARFGQCP